MNTLDEIKMLAQETDEAMRQLQRKWVDLRRDQHRDLRIKQALFRAASNVEWGVKPGFDTPEAWIAWFRKCRPEDAREIEDAVE